MYNRSVLYCTDEYKFNVVFARQKLNIKVFLHEHLDYSTILHPQLCEIPAKCLLNSGNMVHLRGTLYLKVHRC